MAGAERYAADTFQKAMIDLQNAEDFMHGKTGNHKPVETNAREAAQMAEDARIITVRKMAAEERAKEQADAAAARESAERAQLGRGSRPKQQRQLEAQRAAEASRQMQEAQAAAEAARRQQAEADAARAQADAARAAALAEQQKAQAEAERARLSAPAIRPAAAAARSGKRPKCGERLRTAVEHDPGDAPDAARPDRQYFRCVVRFQQIHAEAGSAGETG